MNVDIYHKRIGLYYDHAVDRLLQMNVDISMYYHNVVNMVQHVC